MNGFMEKSRTHYRRLLPLFFLLFAGVVVLTVTQVRVPNVCYNEQLDAAKQMARASSILVSQERELGISPNPVTDPNCTGFIGAEFTPITTTVGALTSKRTSTNPDFAALLVRLLDELHLKPGTRVVLSFSGSFPALNLAAILACEELGLEPLIFSSIGASSYGATYPQMTWLDMERLFVKHGIIHHRTSFASLGAEGDLGESFFLEGKAAALEAIKRNNLIPIIMRTPKEQWNFKVEKIRSFHPELLINVGGNQINVGQDGYLLPPGILIHTSLDPSRLGLIGWFLSQHLPVVHLLRIRDLALRYGLPIDPVPLPVPGESTIYYQIRVRISLVILIYLLIGSYVFYLYRSVYK
jgi:poly-gamma-glutamate system protein